MLVFVDGVEQARIVGARPRRRLLTELAEFLPHRDACVLPDETGRNSLARPAES
jgi:hypothetical protein